MDTPTRTGRDAADMPPPNPDTDWLIIKVRSAHAKAIIAALTLWAIADIVVSTLRLMEAEKQTDVLHERNQILRSKGE